jgi:LysM repeat protein
MLRLFFISCFLYSLPALSQTQKNVQDYIAQYKQIAIREMEAYSIPASVKMGQGILESAAGTSELAIQARNHFGIKCKKDWSGATYTYDDDAKGECFRKYDSALLSFEDHSRFLKNNPRYAELFKLDPKDYKGWAHGLKKAGYATNPQYAQQLIKAIEDYRLYELDLATGDSESGQKPVAYKPPVTEKANQTKVPDLDDFTTGTGGKHEVRLRNKVKYIVVKKGDTYEKLISEFSLMPWEIYRYNDLPRSAVAKEGDIIYLQPKRRKAENATHEVTKGETLRDISQRHAIKMGRIRKLNKIEEGEEPRAGQVLKLR